jgi:hypothetical protein
MGIGAMKHRIRAAAIVVKDDALRATGGQRILLVPYIPQVRNFLKFSVISGFRGSSGESDASPESRRENRLGGTESISRDGQSDLRPLSAMVGWAISAF